jgi:hypothetical protein
MNKIPNIFRLTQQQVTNEYFFGDDIEPLDNRHCLTWKTMDRHPTPEYLFVEDTNPLKNQSMIVLVFDMVIDFWYFGWYRYDLKKWVLQDMFNPVEIENLELIQWNRFMSDGGNNFKWMYFPDDKKDYFRATQSEIRPI